MKGLVVILVFTLFLFWSVDAGWQLTFADEFNQQTKINTTKWNVSYRFSPAVINRELEYYNPDAFTFGPSYLRILGEHRNLSGFSYSSGVITSYSKFSQAYGYFEMNVRLPAGNGYWPAFWLLPQADGKILEIDIFEILGQEPDKVYMTYHCDYTANNTANKQGTYNNSELADGEFHTYSIEWYPGTLIWYIDREQRYNLSNSCIPNTPEYILANLAIGGGWPVPPDNTTVFPGNMDIDYIHVYKYVPSGGIDLGGQVGGGHSFPTPTLDVVSEILVTGASASPETVAPGSTTTITATVFSPTNYSKIHFSVIPTAYFTPVAVSVPSVSLANVDLIQNTSQIFTLNVTIPSNASVGYYKIIIQLMSTNYSVSYLYVDNAIMIGVSNNNSFVVGKSSSYGLVGASPNDPMDTSLSPSPVSSSPQGSSILPVPSTSPIPSTSDAPLDTGGSSAANYLSSWIF